jgi:hypothetical protein
MFKPTHVIPKLHGNELVEIGSPRRDLQNERIAQLHAREEQRLGRVFAMAKGDLRRLANMTFDASGKVDVLKLDAALAGKPIEARMRLKSMLAELGAIAV